MKENVEGSGTCKGYEEIQKNMKKYGTDKYGDVRRKCGKYEKYVGSPPM